MKTTYSTSLKHHGSVHASGIDHTVLVGLEVGRQSADSNSKQYNAPAVALVDPVLTDVPAGTNPASFTLTAARADTAGLYLQDQLTPLRKWKALVGVRADYYEVTQQSLLAPFSQLESLNRTVSPRALRTEAISA